MHNGTRSAVFSFSFFKLLFAFPSTTLPSHHVPCLGGNTELWVSFCVLVCFAFFCFVYILAFFSHFRSILYNEVKVKINEVLFCVDFYAERPMYWYSHTHTIRLLYMRKAIKGVIYS